MEKSRLALAPTRLIEAPPLTVRLLPEDPTPEPSWKTPFESLAITIEDPLPLTVAALLLPLPAAVPLPMISRRGRSRPPLLTTKLLELPAARHFWSDAQRAAIAAMAGMHGKTANRRPQ